MLGGSAETKFSSFELFAVRIVSGEYSLGGTAMISGSPADLPLLPSAHEAVPHRLEGGFSAIRFPLLTLQSHHDKAAAATRSQPLHGKAQGIELIS